MPTTLQSIRWLGRVKRALVILFGFAWSLAAMPVQAQDAPASWQPLGGPVGRISHLAVSSDGADLYAVSVTSLYRKDDQTQWQSSGRAARSDAIYRSQDGGATWQSLTNDLPPAPITALYADSDSPALFAGLNNGLWGSPDRGATWAHIPLSQEDLVIRSIAGSSDGRFLFAGATTADPASVSYVYRSSDGGRTWTAATVLRADQTPGNVLVELIPHPTDASLLFLTTQNGQLYRSPDSGETWQPVKTAEEGAPEQFVTPTCLAIGPDKPQTMLLARSRPNELILERSGDNGASWQSLAATGVPAAARVIALAALRGGVFLLNSDQGTLRSVDSGATWRPLEGPLSSGDVAEFLPWPERARLPSNGAGGAEQVVLAATGYGIFASRDGGALWQAQGRGLPFNSRIAGLLTDARRSEQIWAISDNRPVEGAPQPPLVLHSLDGGRTWSPAGRGLPATVATAWAIDPSIPDSVLVASREYFFQSRDGGLTWQVTGIDPSNHAVIAVAPSSSQVIYLGGNPALRSTDRGKSWQAMPIVLPGHETQAVDVTGLTVDSTDPAHLWAAFDGGVTESSDGGRSWRTAGLVGRKVHWLASGAEGGMKLYAGVAEDGVYRLDGASANWVASSSGLPEHSTILSLLLDSKRPGVLWAMRDGGGVYRSSDGGATWANVAADLGDNLAQAAALDFSDIKSDGRAGETGLVIGTADAGVWALRASVRPPTSPPQALDARIEMVWPHDGAPVTEAKLANIGLRLFSRDSLLQPACSWTPRVTIWQAVDTSPAEPLDEAKQRTIDGQPFPFWELNDVDVSRARNDGHKLYFMVQVAGPETATNIWAHSSDPRTYFPQQDVPSGIANDVIDAVDARIQIVWPHDVAGGELPPAEAPLVNVGVMLFKRGTRLSVPVGWQPASLTLYGAWNHEVGRPLAKEAVTQVRKSGVITYPIWEFTNIPVAQAMDPANRLYLWVQAGGVESYPNIWVHGTDARTAFPVPDEPIQGCVP